MHLALKRIVRSDFPQRRMAAILESAENMPEPQIVSLDNSILDVMHMSDEAQADHALHL